MTWPTSRQPCVPPPAFRRPAPSEAQEDPAASAASPLSAKLPAVHARRLLFGLVAIAAATACVLNPVTQKPDVVLVTEEQEVELGNEAAEQVDAQMGIVDDAPLTAYVAAVGERVARQAPQRPVDYVFQVVDLEDPNAFALPGGHVYVSRGLLAIANDEDELANVLAHEIVHVAARHHAQRQARATGVGLLALPALLAGALIGGPVGGVLSAPFALAGAGVIASYSRDQELEADDFGQRMAASAGYDPEALPRFLEVLERDSRLENEGEEHTSWLDSHPSTPRRASDARRRAADISFEPGTPVAPGRDGFLHEIEGILVGVNPAEGVFEDQRFLHPDLGFTLVFPDGWKTVNTRAAVGAISPDRDAQIVLRLDGKGDDPREAASAFFDEARKHGRIDVARLDSLTINGLQAVRGQAVTSGRGGPVTLDLTWIAQRGNIFLLAGMVPGGYSDAHRATIGETVESFRPITGEERSRIRELRLRLHEARGGESLEAFGRRVGNAWSPEQTAVANGIAPGASLAEGQLLKVAIREPYRGA